MAWAQRMAPVCVVSDALVFRAGLVGNEWQSRGLGKVRGPRASRAQRFHTNLYLGEHRVKIQPNNDSHLALKDTSEAACNFGDL